MSPAPRSPRPGRPVRGSTTGRATMALFDLVGRRWVLRIVWELHGAGSPSTFRALRDACGEISSSVLTRRLQELTEVQIVTHRGDGYVLTEIGEDLVVRMRPLLEWSRTWEARLAEVRDPG